MPWARVPYRNEGHEDRTCNIHIKDIFSIVLNYTFYCCTRCYFLGWDWYLRTQHSLLHNRLRCFRFPRPTFRAFLSTPVGPRSGSGSGPCCSVCGSSGRYSPSWIGRLFFSAILDGDNCGWSLHLYLESMKDDKLTDIATVYAISVYKNSACAVLENLEIWKIHDCFFSNRDLRRYT